MRILPKGAGQWLAFALRLLIAACAIAAVASCMTSMPGRSFSGPLPPLGDMELETSANLKMHIHRLATEIGPRNVRRHKALEAAAGYIEAALLSMELEPKSQYYDVEGLKVRNIEVQIAGSSGADEIIVIGAHYDTFDETPGANDNTSGVAALLELARLLKGSGHGRSVRLVFFVNEEPPYFRTPMMGSRVYASRCRQTGERVVAMISLETMGYYSDEPGSQPYPFPMSAFYPDRGDFIAFVGDLSSRGLLRRSVAAFRRSAEFPSEGISAPRWLTGVDWSDHGSFWQEGYPAIMVTDTAVYRYPYYHTLEDTIDKLDLNRLARVITGLSWTISALADD